MRSSRKSTAGRKPLHAFVLVLLSVTLISSTLGTADDGTKKILSDRLNDAPKNDITRLIETQRYVRKVRLRELQEDSNNNSTENRRPLAVKRGRLDPFNRLHQYKGGYYVKSKHYWGSLAFTGIFGYALAVIWLLLGLLLALSVFLASFLRKRRSPPDSAPNRLHFLYFWATVVTVALVTVAAIGSCVILYVGNNNFTNQARKVEHALIHTANNATDAIDLVAIAIANVEIILEPYTDNNSESTLQTLKSTQQSLVQGSQNVQHTIHRTKRILHKILLSLEVVIVIITTSSLILITIGSGCTLLNWKRLFYFTVTVGWTLAAIVAFLFGITFALNNLVTDTCDAMNEYRENPYNTTLDDLLPCQDLLSASGALVDVAHGIRDSLIKVNNTINQIETKLNFTLPPICQFIGPPPSYDYIDTCPANSISIFGLAQELGPFKCATNDSETCSQEGKLLTEIQYMTVMAYVAGVQILLKVYPSIDRLTNCSIIVNTFTHLVNDNCRSTESAAHLIWSAFLALAWTMMVLIVSWLILTARSRERKLSMVIFPHNLNNVKSYSTVNA